jgi:hypothetical protein
MTSFIDYGDAMEQVLQSLLLAFTNPQSLSNFKEYRYLKTLKDQLQDTLIHVINTMTASSICHLARVLIDNVQVVSVVLQGAFTTKEQTSQVKQTIQHAASLYQSLDMSEHDRKQVNIAVAEMLRSVEE